MAMPRPAPSAPSPLLGSLRPVGAVRAVLALGVLTASAALPAGSAHALALTGLDSYRNLSVSSVFGSGYGGSELVDADLDTSWVISGALGANPQGRDEGWFSFELEKEFIIDQLDFAPRGPSGTVDAIDRLEMWASLSPFNVDVTDAVSTAAFLTSNLKPSFKVAGFAPTPSLPYSYSTGSLAGRYFLVRLLNQTDARSSRNLGARFFQLQGAPMVPGPVPALGVASAFLASRRLRRRCQLR